MSPGYDQSVFTYSPDGRIYQVEYALKGIESSGTALGVRCKDGIVLGVERLVQSKMLVEGGVAARRIHGVDTHVGIAVAGHVPDGRFLIGQARDAARQYKTNFGEQISPRTLNDRIGNLMHITTVYDQYRPFGASLIVGGYDSQTKTHELYNIEPTGMAVRCFGAAQGKGQRAAKTEIDKYKFGTRTVAEALSIVSKILLGVHDEAKDKPMEIELGWICEASGWKYEAVPKGLRDAAIAAAKAQLEAAGNEAGDDPMQAS
jgi:20S proteasome subunit alpha 7